MHLVNREEVSEPRHLGSGGRTSAIPHDARPTYPSGVLTVDKACTTFKAAYRSTTVYNAQRENDEEESDKPAITIWSALPMAEVGVPSDPAARPFWDDLCGA